MRSAARWISGILLFVLGALVVQASFVRLAMHGYRTPSSAMEPTLHCARPAPGCEGDTQDRVLVARFHPFWTPRRGDIVAFRTPPAARLECGAGGTFVKRLIALPGETWAERNGVVYIDGQRLSEPYATPVRGRRNTYPVRKIRAGHFFFMGDNRPSSCDSVVFGSVPRDDLVGPVVARYWPVGRIGSP